MIPSVVTHLSVDGVVACTAQSEERENNSHDLGRLNTFSRCWGIVEAEEEPSDSGLSSRRSRGSTAKRKGESWILNSLVLRVMKAFGLGGKEEEEEEYIIIGW